jgi:hypothetical protein
MKVDAYLPLPEIIAEVFRAEVRRRLAEREAVLQAVSDEEGCGAAMAAIKVAAIWPVAERIEAAADAVCGSYLRTAHATFQLS